MISIAQRDSHNCNFKYKFFAGKCKGKIRKLFVPAGIMYFKEGSFLNNAAADPAECFPVDAKIRSDDMLGKAL
jgi:hypothetical protein